VSIGAKIDILKSKYQGSKKTQQLPAKDKPHQQDTKRTVTPQPVVVPKIDDAFKNYLNNINQ
jgi:hypothetical protein